MTANVKGHEYPFTPTSERIGLSDGGDYFSAIGRSTAPFDFKNEQNDAHTRSSTSDTNVAPAVPGQNLALVWKERIRHFTWTWFTMTMATGGVSNVIYHLPYDFTGRYTIGCVFFLLNIVLFIFNATMIILRFRWYPATFRSSILHPTESLFIPAWLISLGTILMNITEYGTNEHTGPNWLVAAVTVCFWIYCTMAVIFSCGIYLVMWSTQTFTISKMTPVWIFPAYPLLIIAPHAGVLASRLEGYKAVDVIVAGFVFQGIGFLVSLMIYAAFIYRLMTQKLPQESLRPGMFISVGPSGFTIAGVISMAEQLPRVVSPDFMGDGELAGRVSIIMANWMGLWLWGLALWFFLVSVFAHYSTVRHGRWEFAMTWYSYIFPNTALVTATFSIASALNNRPIKILSCVMTCILVVIWMTVFSCMVRAVIVKDVLWPQKQEDRDEGGWLQEKHEEERMRRHDSDGNALRRLSIFGRGARPSSVASVGRGAILPTFMRQSSRSLPIRRDHEIV